MKICKIEGCERKSRSRGWCSMHYWRWWRHGNPDITLREMHGYTKHPLYEVWDNMKQRCYNENNKRYGNYGARGIVICNEWKNSAGTFIEWALPLWKEGLEIDRIDNDGNYEPNNCRFITSLENNQNTQLLRRTNTSGYRGVSYDNDRKKWAAEITVNSKRKHLGRFDSIKKAALAFNNAITDDRPRNIV